MIRRNAAIRASLDAPTVWGELPATMKAWRELVAMLEEPDVKTLAALALERLEELQRAAG